MARYPVPELTGQAVVVSTGFIEILMVRILEARSLSLGIEEWIFEQMAVISWHPQVYTKVVEGTKSSTTAK